MLSSGFHSYPNMLSHREGQNKHVDGNTHKQRYLFFVTSSPFGPGYTERQHQRFDYGDSPNQFGMATHFWSDTTWCIKEIGEQLNGVISLTASQTCH